MERTHRQVKSKFTTGWLVNKYTLSAIVVSVCFYGGCSSVMKKLGIAEDGPVEEILEDILFKETGISVDLSEDTPEPENVNPCNRTLN